MRAPGDGGAGASLAELDARRLYLAEGYSSLFVYCTEALGLSESAAYHRIEAARAALRFPEILDRLTDGRLTLTAVRLLAPHLTEANWREALDAAGHRSTRDVERLAARLAPQPDVPSSVRKLPAPRTTPVAVARVAPPDTAPDRGSRSEGATDPALSVVGAGDVEVNTGAALTTADVGSSANDAPLLAAAVPDPAVRPARPVVLPLAPDRYKIQMTVSAETHDKLRRAQDLLRHAVPDGDLATVFDRALTVLLDQLERAKLAATKRPGMEEVTKTGDGPISDRLRSPRKARQRRGGTAASPLDLPAQAAGGQKRPSGSRYIPAAVKRAVWRRDEGSCAFVGADGHRCAERAFLEYHHRVPYARGGMATVDSICLMCAAHNNLEAERDFGPGVRRFAAGRTAGQARDGRCLSPTGRAASWNAAQGRAGASPTVKDDEP